MSLLESFGWLTAQASAYAFPPELAQLGLAGSILVGVVYMQRANSKNLERMVEILSPMMDVRAEVSRLETKIGKLEGKIDAFTQVVLSTRKASEPSEDKAA